jgi:hypothetical protein
MTDREREAAEKWSGSNLKVSLLVKRETDAFLAGIAWQKEQENAVAPPGAQVGGHGAVAEPGKSSLPPGRDYTESRIEPELSASAYKAKVAALRKLLNDWVIDLCCCRPDMLCGYHEELNALDAGKDLLAELEVLRKVEAAARKLTRFCPAKEEHKTEDDCRIYGCKAGREALAALDEVRRG